MIVKCIAKNGSSLPETCRDSKSGFREDTVFPLQLDKSYQVYGFTLFLGHIWFYICDEHYTYYPRWNPAPLFEVIDGRLSRYWIYGHTRTGKNDKTIVAFREWVDDEFYYDKLSDGDRAAVALFARYKKLMDTEFQSPPLRSGD